MKTLLWDFIKFLHLGALMLYVHPKSALKKIGWFKSFHTRQVIDNYGNPIPWWTYSFIDFISERLNKTMRVLEFGCGASTIYLSKRVNELLSFENYPKWSAKTRTKIKNEKAKIFDVKDITDYNSNDELIYGKFDILIIDNLGNRMDCAVHNLKHLKESGVVVWDNTDGPDWNNIKSFMESQSYKEISFTGMVAQELSLSRTTIFYRADNCLNI